MRYVLLSASLVSVSLLSAALAHDTQTVGEGAEQYQFTIGYVNEPPYTEQLNGLDLIIRTQDDEPVGNLENSLSATIIAPDSERTRELPLRAQYAQPGHYTSDFILSEPGIYTFEIVGFIGGLEADLNLPYDHEVTPADDLRFP